LTCLSELLLSMLEIFGVLFLPLPRGKSTQTCWSTTCLM
jgi:hypothetical protein